MITHVHSKSFQVALVLKDPLEELDGLVPRVLLVLLVGLARLVLLEAQVPLAHREEQVQLGHRAPLVSLDGQVKEVHLEQ